ncbi:hypothetical protein AB0M54_44710 [Actinoplanes sp. NPDC051470]|uniref:hypothetical protein n=1 Tax=Actinoplanes sp. NPDC051470 TaxID=3157224 RepID=UPI0034229478
MLKILSSTAAAESSSFDRSRRRDGEDNVQWLVRNGLNREDGTLVLLIGSRGHLPFRLRVAQSHLRHDLTPSYWSHVALLGPVGDDPASTTLYEISFEPPAGFAVPTTTNGLQRGRLGTYEDAVHHPNIALLRLPVAAEVWQAPTTAGQISVLERYQKQRSVLDATELLLEWLAFLWGVGHAGNPLLDGRGIPSAAMIESLLNAAGYDLTPSLESRASCPEAVWQAAKWWHPYYGDRNAAPIEGFWHTGHKIEL